MDQDPTSSVVVRIIGAESQHNGPDPDLDAEIAVAYQFEMVKGQLSEAMAILSEYPSRVDWLTDVAPAEDGWMVAFGLPPGVSVLVGMEVDMKVGPRKRLGADFVLNGKERIHERGKIDQAAQRGGDRGGNRQGAH
ncbi:hypothetical protein [Eleftheria terrae]|uniref:hypothetical protein n=1 Tax=Eleftheria terrae TaxID=1597781 RepID=UPI00263B3359|nr:hypothetical protein [Eleftheria terrae]WKB56020.1 hypothetical protein N7L95_28545 [Eleftheria terrae]